MYMTHKRVWRRVLDRVDAKYTTCSFWVVHTSHTHNCDVYTHCCCAEIATHAALTATTLPQDTPCWVRLPGTGPSGPPRLPQGPPRSQTCPCRRSQSLCRWPLSASCHPGCQGTVVVVVWWTVEGKHRVSGVQLSSAFKRFCTHSLPFAIAEPIIVLP